MQAVSLLLLSPDGFVCGSHGQIYEEILKKLKKEKEILEVNEAHPTNPVE